MFTIKPHHFIDIIKLFGRGIELFVPDEKYRHDFYAVANEIIKYNGTELKITIDRDDICSPCKYLGDDGLCTDNINHIDNITSKDEWNKILDRRIIKFAHISEDSKFTAAEFCKILYSMKEMIFEIWKEEDDSAKKTRYEDFCTGAVKFLEFNQTFREQAR